MNTKNKIINLIMLFFLCNSYIFAQNKVNWIVEPNKYSQISQWGYERYFICENGKWGVINSDGKTILLPRYDAIISFYDANYLNEYAFLAKENGKYGVIHIRNLNKWALLPEFAEPMFTSTLSYLPEEEKWIGYKNDKEWLLSIDSEGVRAELRKKLPEQSNVLATIGTTDLNYQNDTKKSADNSKILIWKDKYKGIQPIKFVNNNIKSTFYIVRDNKNMYGIIDSAETIILDFKYFSIAEVQNNVVAVEDDNTYRNPQRFAFVRVSDGKIMSKGKYWSYWANQEIEDKVILIQTAPIDNTEKVGLLNSEGEELIYPDYEGINILYPSDAMPAKKIGHWGLINKKNEVILPFEFDEIIGLNTKLKIFRVMKNGKVGVCELKK